MANVPNNWVIDETAMTVAYNPLQTITPASMTGIRVGALLQADAYPNASEIVQVVAATATTFSAYFAKAHAASFAITAAPINTVTLGAVTSANNSVALASLQNIAVGSAVRFTGGTAETLIVQSINPVGNVVTFTTNFTQSHLVNTGAVTDPAVSTTAGATAIAAPTVQPYLELIYARRIPMVPLTQGGAAGSPVLNADILVRVEDTVAEGIIQGLAGTSGAPSVAPLLTAFSGGNPTNAAALARPSKVLRARVGDTIQIINPVTVTVGAGAYGYDEIIKANI